MLPGVKQSDNLPLLPNEIDEDTVTTLGHDAVEGQLDVVASNNIGRRVQGMVRIVLSAVTSLVFGGRRGNYRAYRRHHDC